MKIDGRNEGLARSVCSCCVSTETNTSIHRSEEYIRRDLPAVLMKTFVERVRVSVMLTLLAC